MTAYAHVNVIRPAYVSHDVLGVIPTIVENDGIGEMPKYYSGDPFVTVQEFATAVFDLVVGPLTCLWNMATHLVEIGLELIGSLTTAAANTVHDAVQAIVDAFDAFVDWIVEFVTSTLGEIFDPMVQSIEDAIDSYTRTVAAAFRSAEDDLVEHGHVTSSSLSALHQALGGKLFDIMLAVGMVMHVALTAFSVLTGGLGFLVTTVGAVVVGYVIQQVLRSDAFQGFVGTTCDAFSGLYSWMDDTFGPGDDPTTDEQIAWGAFGLCMGVVGQFYSLAGLLAHSLAASVSFACGIVSIVLGTAATAMNSIGLGLLGIAFGTLPVMHSLCGAHMTDNPITRSLSIITAIFGGVGIFCSAEGLE